MEIVNNHINDDFIEFVKILIIFEMVNPMMTDIPDALTQFYFLMTADERTFNLKCFILPDQKLIDIHILFREIYKEYLEYGGLILENASKYQKRYFDIMKGEEL